MLPNRRHYLVFLMLLGLSGLCTAGASADGLYDCSEQGQCGLPGERHDRAYGRLVLGKVLDIADDDTALTIYHWAREQGYWSKLPDDPSAFLKAIQIMAVEIPAGTRLEPVTLLMGRKDFDAAGIKVGDFVRYTPHPVDQVNQPGYPNNPKDAYWEIFGCIAVLCSAEDVLCPGRYVAGLYDTGGLPIDRVTGQVDPARIRIDPTTYMPLTTPSGSERVLNLLSR